MARTAAPAPAAPAPLYNAAPASTFKNSKPFNPKPQNKGFDGFETSEPFNNNLQDYKIPNSSAPVEPKPWQKFMKKPTVDKAKQALEKLGITEQAEIDKTKDLVTKLGERTGAIPLDLFRAIG